MASSKQKTTMNKLNRERKVREKRLDKAARKVARANGEIDIHTAAYDPFEDYHVVRATPARPEPADPVADPAGPAEPAADLVTTPSAPADEATEPGSDTAG
jgi:hypothetical protein